MKKGLLFKGDIKNLKLTSTGDIYTINKKKREFKEMLPYLFLGTFCMGVVWGMFISQLIN